MNGDGYGVVIVIFGLVCAIIGWCTIELIIWLFSFVHISVGLI